MIMESSIGLNMMIVFFSLAVIGIGMGLKNHYNFKKLKAKIIADEESNGSI